MREQQVLSLTEAIAKMTYLPAQRLGLTDRGFIKEGNKADIVILDPEKVIDRSDFNNPHQYPSGILHVLVNGTLSIENGEETSIYNGKVLRKE